MDSGRPIVERAGGLPEYIVTQMIFIVIDKLSRGLKANLTDVRHKSVSETLLLHLEVCFQSNDQ
jgi:hypothetical protein